MSEDMARVSKSDKMEPAINVAQDSMKSAIEKLDKTVTDLQDKLTPALGPELSVPRQATAEKEPESPIAEFLKKSTDSILNICFVLDDTIARIQC